jgi:hypothetical protein
MREMAGRHGEPGPVWAQSIAATVLVTLSLLAGCGAGPKNPAQHPAGGPVAAKADASAQPQGAVRTPRLKLTAERSDPFLDELQARTFRFFWELANPANGLVPDRWPDGSLPDFCSIAAVGFGLTAYPIGVQRGLITRAEARDRVLATLRFFAGAPQGPELTGKAGYKGFFYHFLNMRTGVRYAQDVELSSIDTALLLAGALACQTYFDGTDPGEAEIRTLADALYRAADWSFFQPRPPLVSMGWTPPGHFNALDWRGYNEAMILYVLALGSPSHPVSPPAWADYTSTYTWASWYGQEYVAFPPLFGHQFSHVWVDFRGIQDDYMRGRGIDYFENTRRAVYAQRAYAIANPIGWAGYGAETWGVTACDGPADVTLTYNGTPRRFWTYAGRGAGATFTLDDGTIAPTGAAASIPFAPEIAVPAVKAMRDRYGGHLYSTYGFFDAFNPSFTFTGAATAGQVVPGQGWYDTDYLGLDQGPIVAMIENYRNGFVWTLMRKNTYIVNGLRRAGFSGSWLAGAPE